MLGKHTISLGLSALVGMASLAAAIPVREEKRAGVTPVSSSTISSFTPYTQIARAAYCPNGLATWKCGPACNAVPGVIPYASGGDGAATPFWFVGYWPSKNSVIVTHQGTDPTEFLALLNDADVFQDPLDSAYFPGLPSNLRVHGGFQATFKRSASAVRAAVQRAVNERGTKTLTLVGHSLGGAIATLDHLYFRTQMPTLTIKSVLYGVPRVGNPEFASYLAGYDLTRINNDSDPIPIVPGRFLGFGHPHGEIHINDDAQWNYCSGKDNEDEQCSTGHVDNIFVGNIIDHLGTYNGVWVGSIFC